MKKNIILWSFLLILVSFFMLLGSEGIKAKQVSTNDFSITIGNDNIIWISSNSLEKNDDNSYTLHFKIQVEGNNQENLTFSFKSEMIYYVNETKYTEVDLLENNGNYFSSSESYTFDLYDEDMPTFILGEEGPIDKIYFQFTFECISNPSYTYATQISPLMELEVKYDYTAPTLCDDKAECSYLNNYSYLTKDYQFHLTASDDNSGVTSIKYFFSRQLYSNNINQDEFSNQISNGGTFYYNGERGTFINYEDITTYIYLYILVEDTASNYLCIYFIYYYTWEKSENNLIYEEENSSIPNENNYYKAINVKIETDEDLYYCLSYNSYIDIANLKTSEYLYDKEKGIQFSTSYTCKVYVYIVQFGSDNSYTYLILCYNFDNTAPSITDSKYPQVDMTYKNVTLNFQFFDNSGVSSSYYKVSSSLLKDVELITDVYEIGTDLTIGEGLNGEYYIYFAVYDNLENINSFYLHYIFDNTPPILTLSISEQDALEVSNGKSIKLTLNELKGTTFKCKWALNNIVLTENDLDATCTKDSTISAPNNSEGYYRLWAYLEDEVGNTTLYYSYPFLIDSKGPNINVTPIYIDTIYRENNNIEVNATDLFTGVSSIYYNWFLYEENITSGTSIPYKVSSKINYPSDSYGIYALWIYAIDGAGNATLYKDSNKYYVDTEKYNLTLIGNQNVKIVKNEKFVDPGVKALKGEREVSYQIESNLDITKVGVYTITYTLDDLVITRNVEVTSTSSYYLIIGVSTFLGLIISFVPFKKKRI